MISSNSPTNHILSDKPVYNNKEDFDPTLSRLNTLNKLASYCDSLYKVSALQNGLGDFSEKYTDIAYSVVRNRFYHGYSSYDLNNNFMAVMMGEVAMDGLSAIVIPDDILEFPYAACSQQSIVLMEVLRRKGISTRKVGFKGTLGGHFSMEVYFGGLWHFYDANMEPDIKVLAAYNKPEISFLVSHPDVLQKAYKQYPAEKINDLFPTYSYGSIDAFPAPKAIIFHRITKFLSYTLWSFFLLAFIWARKKYKALSRAELKRKRMVFPNMEPLIGNAHYNDYRNGLEVRV